MTTLDRCFRPDQVPGVEDMRVEYRETVQVFKDGGADLMLFESFNSSKEARVALETARELEIPAWVGLVVDWRAHLLDGETMDELRRGLAGAEPDALLFNCAPVPDVTRALGELARQYHKPIGGYAHVGRFDPPDWMFTDEYPPEQYLDAAHTWVATGARSATAAAPPRCISRRSRRG